MEAFPRSWPSALGHPPRYRWHKYWGRKPHNVVAALLAHHLPPHGALLDLFSGSGVAAAEALALGHRAVALDLSPVAIGILTQTMAGPSLATMDAVLARIAERVAGRIDGLYASTCRSCRTPVTLACAIWQDDRLASVRYLCPACGHRGLDEAPTAQDEALAGADDGAGLPRIALAHANGEPFQESQGAGQLGELFVPRARLALGWLLEAINAEPPAVQPTLRLLLTSVVHLVSRLCPVPKPAPSNHATPFSSFWAQHSFNRPALAMEQPVWRKFQAGYWGHQGWRRAQLDVARLGSPVTLAASAEAWAGGEGRLWAEAGPALDGLHRLAEAGARFDLLFADPPYGGTIQYGELSTLWNAFLLDDPAAHQAALLTHEVVCSRPQGKALADYYRQLQAHFAAARPLLTPAGSAIVTFHSPKGDLRHAAIGAIVGAGFRLTAIRHNAGARLSSKACRQPFGSVEGDFWLHFVAGTVAKAASGTDWPRRVVALAETVLGQAAAPLPFPELINRLEPVLAAEGFFADALPPVALDGVLKQASGERLRLVKGEVAGVPGYLWTVQENRAEVT